MQSQSTHEANLVLTGFQWGGCECPVDDSNCVAKQAFDPATGNTMYWAKRASRGPEAGFLYNPLSANFIGNASEYVFKKVTEEAFGLYKQFLVTGNTSYVRNAERHSK